MSYPNYYQPNYYPNQQINFQNQQGIIWVQGESGAKSYLVAPNNTVTLWDSENEVIYLKSADANGMPSMKILDYKVREQGAAGSNPQYVTKEEFSNIEKEIKVMKRIIHGLTAEVNDAE